MIIMIIIALFGRGARLETVINSQLPHYDDIDFRSLEYLFGTSIEVSPVAPAAGDTVVDCTVTDFNLESRSPSAVEVLERLLKECQRELAESTMHVGYLRGLLEEKNEQLKLLPQLRLQAAKGIAADVERNVLLSRIAKLESENAEFQSHLLWRIQQSVKHFCSDDHQNEWLAILELVVLAVFCSILACTFRVVAS